MPSWLRPVYCTENLPAEAASEGDDAEAADAEIDAHLAADTSAVSGSDDESCASSSAEEARPPPVAAVSRPPCASSAAARELLMLNVDTRRPPAGVDPLPSAADGKKTFSETIAGETASGEPPAVKANERAEPRVERTLPPWCSRSVPTRRKLLAGLRE